MHILAGRYKGRKILPPPAGSETRPITARAKKSLFDALGGLLEGSAVVDLYCGTGSMGLEALSRGAGACWFAEKDPAVLQRLRRNIEALGVAERCAVWAGDAARGLARRLAEMDAPVGVGFVDPPYAMVRRWSWRQAGDRIFLPLAERLAEGGRVVLRVPAGAEPPEPPGGLEVLRRRQYGEMVVLTMG